MRRRFTLPLLSLALLTLPVAADPRPDILYTTRKEFVQVRPAHQLTLNAHIDKFAYDPLGLEVACTGSETQGDQTTYFVKTLDARTGKELHRLAIPDARFNILGWTPSGKFLLLERTQTDEDGSGDNVTDLVRWDLSADPPKLRPVDAPFTLPEGARVQDTFRFASLHGRRVLLVDSSFFDDNTHSPMLVYDAEQDTVRPLPRPAGVRVYLKWTDDTHLVVRLGKDKKQQQMDVVTGQLSPLNTQTSDDPMASKQYPDLTVDVEAKSQPDPKGSGQFPSRIVWVRCEPRQEQPLSAVGAGITMGKDDPLAVWAPGGKQLAFLNHGDLYVTDLAPVPTSELLGNEKAALGLPLTCPEERELAVSNLKKIGLGLIMYTQDHNENYPAAAGVEEAITPYIKDRTVFSVGTIHWAYHAPENLSLAAMESPAITVIGTTTLPCGQVTLMGDGHVKIMTGKEEAP